MKKISRLERFNLLLVFAVALITWSSCKTDKIRTLSEPVKAITGTWKIIKATRNGTDITSIVDTNIYNFNKFQLTFTGNTYTVTNPLPFIVSANGTYSVDNPQYPFLITFTATGSTTPVSTAFTYPIVNGIRVLTLVFSPGCPQNAYSYSFVKVN